MYVILAIAYILYSATCIVSLCLVVLYYKLSDLLTLTVHGVKSEMAGTIQLRAPEAYDFKKLDEWLKWHKRFKQFRVASGLSAESKARQVSTLLYCMGEEAEDVLTSTNITTDEKKNYETVLGKFNEYFKVRKNFNFERARFNRRNQLTGESVEHYITDLYRL